MSEIKDTRQHLEEVKSNFIEGKIATNEGKSHIQTSYDSFRALQEAKVNASQMALGIVGKLLNIQCDLDKLAEIAGKGQEAVGSLSTVDPAIEAFFGAKVFAGMGCHSLSSAMDTKQPPQHAIDAFDKAQLAEQTTRDIALETAAANGIFGDFQQNVGGLHTSIEQIRTNLSNLNNDLSSISHLPMLKGPEENRNPRFVARVANEAITAFEAEITDIDQHLGEV